MKKTRLFITLFGVLLVVAFPGISQAQFRLDFFGAGNFPQSKDFEISVPQSTVPLKGTHEFSVGARGGVRLGYDGRGHWGQDFVYSYGSNASRIINHTNSAQYSISNRIHQISYNGLWYPGGLSGKKKVFPYLTAGVGGTIYAVTQSAINDALDPNRGGIGRLRTEGLFSFNAGAGIRIRVNSLYGFRIDVRDHISRPVRYGLPRSSSDPKATVFPVTGIFNQIEVSFAFVYYFR